MRILLTNDDGVNAEGLQVLSRRLSADHEVWVVAPDTQRSGMSHAVTLHDSVSVQRLEDRVYACSGTPADCVLYGLLGAIPVRPDIVVSGINHGANIGTDIIYSGTAAAARQAALTNVPGVAISLVLNGGVPDFKTASSFVHKRLDLFLRLWEPDFFFNVNVPAAARQSAEVVVTRPALRIYNDELKSEQDGDGRTVYSLHGSLNGAHIEEGTDWDAVEKGRISVSPINLHPLNQSGKESYHSTQFRLG